MLLISLLRGRKFSNVEESLYLQMGHLPSQLSGVFQNTWKCSIPAGPEEALEEGVPMLPTPIAFPGSTLADPEPTCWQQGWAVAAVAV